MEKHNATTWAKPDCEFEVPYCAIKGIEAGRLSTMCHGSWATSDTQDVDDDPPADERCQRCQLMLSVSRTLTPVERPLAVYCSRCGADPCACDDDLVGQAVCEGGCDHIDCEAIRPYVDDAEAFESAETIVIGPRPTVLLDFEMADVAEEWGVGDVGGES